MSMDPNRKTLRHFYCSDMIWQMFEQMSEAKDRGVDELVNEAMQAFAEQSGYLVGPDTDAQPSGLYVPDPSRVPAVPPPLPAARMTAHYAGRPPLPAGPAVAVPPPIPGAASAPPLYLIFGNQKLIVDKEQFIIGRGPRPPTCLFATVTSRASTPPWSGAAVTTTSRIWGRPTASISMASASRRARLKRVTSIRSATTSSASRLGRQRLSGRVVSLGDPPASAWRRGTQVKPSSGVPAKGSGDVR
jgi:hypothetical protein